MGNGSFMDGCVSVELLGPSGPPRATDPYVSLIVRMETQSESSAVSNHGDGSR